MKLSASEREAKIRTLEQARKSLTQSLEDVGSTASILIDVVLTCRNDRCTINGRAKNERNGSATKRQRTIPSLESRRRSTKRPSYVKMPN